MEHNYLLKDLLALEEDAFNRQGEILERNGWNTNDIEYKIASAEVHAYEKAFRLVSERLRMLESIISDMTRTH